MKKKQVFLISLLVIGIAGYFWTQSRYPALNQKAMMAESMHTQGLSFGVIYEIHPGDPLLTRILYSTINWMNTNRQGMTFSIFFGGAVLTFLKLVKWRGKANVFLNSLKGALTGTPLGVCANCVAPIGKGMYDSGTRVETVLSAMITSPTLNVVVLTMIFALFPFSFAVTKVMATVIFALIFVPFVTKFFFKEENKGKGAELPEDPADMAEPSSAQTETWGQAAVGATKAYLRDLWYIFKTTVPLMALAGFLGAVFIELFPLQNFVALNDSPLTAVGLALLAAILPAPITFDVIVAYSLNSAGLSLGLTMIFLFATGTFSIYPFMVLWNTMSRKVAVFMMVGTVAFSLLAGFGLQAYENHRLDKSLQIFDEHFENAEFTISSHIGEPVITHIIFFAT